MARVHRRKQIYLYLVGVIILLILSALNPSPFTELGLRFMRSSRQAMRKTYDWSAIDNLEAGSRMYPFLDYMICPELMSLSRKNDKDIVNLEPACRTYTTTSDDCHLARKMHSKIIERCPNQRKEKKICESNEFSSDYHDNKKTRATLSCHVDACAKVAVGKIDPHCGVFPPVSDWPRFHTKTELEKNAQVIIKKSVRSGFNFILLRCLAGNDTTSAEQLLMFSHQPTKKPASLKKNINLNFLVLDSLSRPHFYRMLPKTVSELIRIKHTRHNDLEVLDFEMVQSIAPFTIHNIRALMSGKAQQGKSEKPSYKFQELLKLFKKRGYFTLLQEDSCWHDTWGTMFNGNKKKQTPFKAGSKTSKYKTYWKHFLADTKNLFIDDYGVTHVSCEAFKMYGGRSNQYGSQMPSVCLHDKPLCSYYLEYVRKTFIGRHGQNEQRQSPFLSYTHLNTAHERSGMRIKECDDAIADFFFAVTKLHNTLTIFLSDHGAKSSSYSRTKQGQVETYNPFLFMIIPRKVRQMIGKNSMKTLRENQKRLLTFVEVHHTIMSLLGPHSQLNRNCSLFAPIPANRTCNDLSLESYALCICKDSYRDFPDNSTQFASVAQFAVSVLNKIIDKQFLKSKQKDSRKCHRLRLNYFTGIRQTRRHDGVSLISMYVDVNARTPTEVFEVQVKHFTKKGKQILRLVSWRRISVYQGFESCKDRTVDVKLCIC